MCPLVYSIDSPPCQFHRHPRASPAPSRQDHKFSRSGSSLPLRVAPVAFIWYTDPFREGYVQPLNGIDSKFRLAILVARRAKQLIGGARRKVDVKSDNTLTVALEEFRQGKIDFDVLNEEDSFFGQEAGSLEGAEAAAAAALEGEDADLEAEDAEEPEKEAEPESES